MQTVSTNAAMNEFSPAVKAALEAYMTSQSGSPIPPDEIRMAITAEIKSDLANGITEAVVIQQLQNLTTNQNQ